MQTAKGGKKHTQSCHEKPLSRTQIRVLRVPCCCSGARNSPFWFCPRGIEMAFDHERDVSELSVWTAPSPAPYMTKEHFRVALLRPQPSFNPILLPPGPTDGNHAMPCSITPALNTFSHHNNCSTMVETNCSTIFLLQSCRKNPAKNAPFSLFFSPHPAHCSVSALAARQTWTRQHLQVECQISFLFSLWVN